MPISRRGQFCSEIPNNERTTGHCKGRLFVLIGGFLGAGKTSALIQLTSFAQSRGNVPALITNDQSDGLVDSALAGQQEAPLGQVAGGCFCCRLDQLIEVLHRLENPPTAGELGTGAIGPAKAASRERDGKNATSIEATAAAVGGIDVFIAEPVGSCTDLMATVLLPLKRVYRKDFRVAPLSVMLDARRAWGHFCGRGGGSATAGFSKDVRYIFAKQMEEAEILALNKCDLLSTRQRATLVAKVKRAYPGKRVFEVSVRTGEGLDAWFGSLWDSEMAPQELMEVDYERYGVGEAKLGWLNLKVRVEARKDDGLDGNAWLERLTARMRTRLLERGVSVAHMKMSLASERDGLAVVQWVRNEAEAEFTQRLKQRLWAGTLLLNLRAEADPDVLAAEAFAALAKAGDGRSGATLSELTSSHFKPGQPVPVRRFSQNELEMAQ